MDWMHTHQLSSKNLTAGEKTRHDNRTSKRNSLRKQEKKKEKANEQFYGNRFTENKESVESTPIGVQSKSRSDTWTDSQTAKKKAGVGIGTVARYNRVMNSDEAKQRKVAVEYVKLCGYKNGEMGNGRKKDSHNGKATQLTP